MPILETAISLFAPHKCLVCDKEGAIVCSACMTLEIAEVPSRCYRCLQATKDFATCKSCRSRSKLGHVWVRSLYEDVSSRLVLSFKYERARSAYVPIAKALAETIPLLPQNTIVIGVPTATSRIRQRGYDHTKLIVREFATATGLVWTAPVVRSGQAHQFGSSRQVRRRQLERTFRVVSPNEVKDKSILLVDDVVTTGATLETLAQVLKTAGAKRVDAITFAQKL